ncbi:hypothetical protein BCR37DRAFT_391362 [Protomyces lactucae-debilis]|uniref:Uncharacterized protein n=1 Tax=Protomyces lactucae-debilis TaxID=2754530 RepID=A0A1Y2FNL7_PROLT|nr:uncharacterized protein BCR37DRAFT_391362 [Protomyces lactucae-debilis]ORY85592.1 hypothetical protein BCR37DRAFT_391362 [Protomyces lactucae-debilis]
MHTSSDSTTQQQQQRPAYARDTRAARHTRRLHPQPPTIPSLSFPATHASEADNNLHASICKQFQQSANALHICKHECTRTLRRRSTASSTSSSLSRESSGSVSPIAVGGHLDDHIDPQFSNTIQQVLNTLLTYERLFRKNAIPQLSPQTELTDVYAEISELLGELTAYAGEATAEMSVITQVLISLTIKKHGQAVTEAVARFAEALKQESARLEHALAREEEEAIDLAS